MTTELVINHEGNCLTWYLCKSSIVKDGEKEPAEKECILVVSEKPPLRHALKVREVTISVAGTDVKLELAAEEAIASILSNAVSVSNQVLQAAAACGYLEGWVNVSPVSDIYQHQTIIANPPPEERRIDEQRNAHCSHSDRFWSIHDYFPDLSVVEKCAANPLDGDSPPAKKLDNKSTPIKLAYPPSSSNVQPKECKRSLLSGFPNHTSEKNISEVGPTAATPFNLSEVIFGYEENMNDEIHLHSKEIEEVELIKISDGCDDEALLHSVATERVEVMNVPAHFEKAVLLHILNDALWKLKDGKILTRPTKGTKELTIDMNGSVIVEFISVDLANETCRMVDLFYEDHLLVLKQVKEQALPINIPTERIRLSNVPDDFEKAVLLHIINDALWKWKDGKILSRPIKGAKKLTIEKSGAVIVELTSVDLAKEACKMTDLFYEDYLLTLEQIQEKAAPSSDFKTVQTTKNVLTNKVEVINVPADYEKAVLLHIINDSLWKWKNGQVLTRPTKGANKCWKDSNGSVIVEFTTMHLAREACEMFNPFYEDSLLRLEHIKEKEAPKGVTAEEVKNLSVSSCFRNVASPKLVLTKKVEVINVPSDFEKAVLLHIINDYLWKWKDGQVLTQPTKGANKCWKDSNETVIVEFATVHLAREACEILDLYYEGRPLVLHHIEEEVFPENALSYSSAESECAGSKLLKLNLNDGDLNESEEESEDDVALKNSCYVQISNLPSKFDKAEFTKLINQAMITENLPGNREDIVQRCSEISYSSSGDGCVIVKFRTCEEANLASLLENLKYGNKYLTVRKYLKGIDGSADLIDHSPPVATISLQSEGGTVILMRALIKYRHTFPKTGCLDSALQDLLEVLKKKGVLTTLVELRARRKTLREQYRRIKKNANTSHQYYIPLSVIFGDQEVTAVRDSQFDPDGPDAIDEMPTNSDLNSQLAKFCKVASWTTSATKYLIHICIDNQEEFDKPKLRSKFWRNVQEIMVQKRFYYTSEQCENKMATMTAAYKDFLENSQRTGAAGPSLQIRDDDTRDIMTLMAQLLQGSVAVEPKLTVAAGFQFKHSIGSSGTSHQSVADRQPGRARTNLLQRPPTLAERKLRIAEKKADALSQIAETFANRSGGSSNGKKLKDTVTERDSASIN